MNPSQSSDETIFSAALTLPSGEWSAFLDAACAGDACRRARIESLLRVPEDAPDFMATSAAEIPPPIEASTGDMIGRYKLLQRIGEGGIGVVFMAEQEKPIRRRVAMKVIKLGMDTKEVVARFEAERQALALMDHPNIARVFDAGATASGRPFFVMELVRGIPITKFCDEQNLPTKARLELFMHVCHAVQHAHQKGIIHRDLKPSNILVTLHDGVPVPKVIDFGIAKATQGRLTDSTLFTAFEQFIGTPAYMSPEQAEMSGLDIDTRSDIYSLGVLLYELLAGRPPFDPKTLGAAGLDEIRRIIREVEPPRPSTRLNTLEDPDRATIARQRATVPARLSSLLHGELDWVVMRCLEKDRTRRYETADGLALDVLRYLHHEPVVARPPSASYRLRKFVRRHRTGVAASVVVAVVLIGGIAGSSWQAVRATRAEKLAATRLQSELLAREDAERQRRLAEERLVAAEAARGEAERQQSVARAESARAREAEKSAQSAAKKSTHVAAFMTAMLKAAGPSVALGRDTALLREITDLTARRLDELKDEPDVEADLRFTLGRVYFDLGEYATATTMLRDALILRQRTLDASHTAIGDAMFHFGCALTAQSNYLEAETHHREALTFRKRSFGSEHVDVASSLNELGIAIRMQGNQRYAEAEELMREGLAMRRRLLGGEHLDVATSLSDLGSLLFRAALSNRSSQTEAEAMHREAVAIRRKLLGDSHPDVANALNRLGSSLSSQRRFEEAQEVFREALVTRRKALGNDHPDVAHSLHNLAGAVRELGWIAEAETLAREALAIRRKRLGSDHYEVGFSLNALALQLRQEGRLEEAEGLQREAVEIYRKAFPNGNTQLAVAIATLGSDLRTRKKLAEAELLFREALAMRRKLAGENRADLRAPIQALSTILHEQGKLEEAAELVRELGGLPATPTNPSPSAGNALKYTRTGPAESDAVSILNIRHEASTLSDHQKITLRVQYALSSHPKGILSIGLNHTGPNRFTRVKSQPVENGSGECEFVIGVAPAAAGHPLRVRAALFPSPPSNNPLASHAANVELK